MNRLYLFLIQNDVWIYILCGLGLIWYLSELFRARRLLLGAMYGLEQERGRSMFNNALLFIVLFAAIAGSVAYINIEVAPTLPPEMLQAPTLTPNPFSTPFASPTPRGTDRPTQPPPTPPLAPTVTLRDELALPVPGTGEPDDNADGADGTGTPPSTTAVPTATLSESTAGCSSAANISQPANGWEVFGEVPFLGTAAGDSFAGYRLEIIGPQTNDSWTSLIGGTANQPIVNGQLGVAALGTWTNGRYRARLVVVQQDGSELGPCVVEFDLNN